MLPSAEISRDSQAISSSCNAPSADSETCCRANLESHAIDRIELPRGQDRHDPWRQLDMHEFTRRASLHFDARRVPPMQRMPAILDHDLLPDMGRMTVRLR